MPATRFEFLPTLRELVRTYQAFDAFSGSHIRTLGLTTPQFDVIATLGNTQGMNCRDIGQKTLMVKGTLTGVLDRLEQKGLITRISHPTDGRSTLVRLSPAGEELFARVFSAHLAHLEPVFALLGRETLETLRQHLEQLRHSLEKQSDPSSDQEDFSRERR
ncbi:MarR family transcriptional regulator [Ferrovum sp.]|uniref:MarR family winged helix-turn-helix transcriptional regulator n=1 Tax=Ferrovum sp. TaxID=2609467 RepID=UPI00260660C6|nr:MarR family transcriptional regulator [Ferrovum sp.]